MSSASSSSSAAPEAGYLAADSPLLQHSGGPSASISGSSWAPPPAEAKGVPRPFEALLHGPPIPPFLSKTYDLVDDPALDPVISWGPRWTSFVIWDPAQFSKAVLPLHFKHNNFSSFVRQLNVYGFRKIDPDRWEFANEEFKRGNKLLLKNIIRRRSCQVNKLGVQVDIQGEIGLLISEKSALKEEITVLQQEQLKTLQKIDVLNERMQMVEHRQKQTVSFLAKVLQNPGFLARLRQKKEQRQIASPRARRKFLKHDCTNQTASISLMDDNRAKNILQYTEDVTDRELPDMNLHGMVEKLGLEKIPENLETDSSNFLVHETLAIGENVVSTCSPEDTCCTDGTYTGPADEIGTTNEEFWKVDLEIGQESWGSLLPYSFDLDVAAGFGTLWDLDSQDAREGLELGKSMNDNFSLKEHQIQR